MQAVSSVVKPFTAAVPQAARPAGRRLAVVRAAAGEPDAQPALARRSVAALLAAAPILLPASRALALIPDDDDEELVQKAKENRRQRLASERQTEQAFSRSARGLGASLGGLWPGLLDHRSCCDACHTMGYSDRLILGGYFLSRAAACHANTNLLPSCRVPMISSQKRSSQRHQRHLSSSP
jgi:hypothetical protein